ncbi:MAG TPA: ATP-binding protein [Bacteroidales bacterium]
MLADHDRHLFEEEQLHFINHISKISSFEILKNIFDSFSVPSAILTPSRRVVYANYSLWHKLGFNSLEQIMGMRPGEAISCVYAIENHVCGVSRQCNYCGALNAIKKVQSEKVEASSEMHATIFKNGEEIYFDFRVVVSPVFMDDKLYMILKLIDISNEKRRKALERIFFHDVLNKVSQIKGMFEIVNKKWASNKPDEYLDMISGLIGDLSEEIVSQRMLLSAENGELKVNFEGIIIQGFIESAIRQCSFFNNVQNAVFDFVPSGKAFMVFSDRTLLNRIITNLLKNAMEAAYPNEVIKISVYQEDSKAKIEVCNKRLIPQDNIRRIFHRSFSTKGENRGLGTYSVKLLAEKYLKGKVSVVSTEETGTIFTLELPIAK